MANLAGERSNNNLADLPHDLHLKILSLIASVSVTDLFNVTRTCKSLHQAGTHPIVLQNAAVWSEFYAFHTRRLKTKKAAAIDVTGGVARFVSQCVNSGNPESMLCLQMAEYFLSDENLCNLENEKNQEEAIRCLKTADSKGLVAARAVCGVIYLISGGGKEDEEFGVVRKMIERSEEDTEEWCRAGMFMLDCVSARKLRLKKDDFWLKFMRCIRMACIGRSRIGLRGESNYNDRLN